MGFELVEGFESFGANAGDTQDGLEEKYTSSSGVNDCTVQAGRVYGRCLRLATSSDIVFPGDIINASELTVGFAVRKVSGTSNAVFFRLNANSLPSGFWGLFWSNSGSLQLQKQETTVDTYTATLLNDNAWHYINFYALIDASAGSIEVYVDGVLRLSFTGDTVGVGLESGTSVKRFRLLAGLTTPFEFDDFYIYTGGKNVFEAFVDTIFPTADDSVAFTPSTGMDNYALVDEVPADGDTTYVESSTNGHTDLYELQDGVPGSIEAVEVNVRCRSTSGSTNMRPTLETGGVEHAAGSATSISTSYVEVRATYDVNPETTTPWISSDVDALLAGQKVG